MNDLIFISLEDWDEIWRRNQFLCASLARRFPNTKILFVGMPWNLTYHLRRGSWRQLCRRLTRALDSLPNITLTHPPKLFPDSLLIGRKCNEALARWHVRRVARNMGISDPLLWLNPQGAVHMAGRMGERSVVYDITDDWTLAPSFSQQERQRIVEADQALCRRADLVIVCSQTLEKSRADLCRKILLLQNGVDVDHYLGSSGATTSSRWPRPVFGYTGTLHADRTNVQLTVDVARAFPCGSVVLVGPNHLSQVDRKLLASVPNIFTPGPVPYEQIPGVMAQFDVCIVPHVETPFTESLNPLKLWEYLAVGKPIVSTNVAGFREYRHLCRVASDRDDFLAGCREGLRENGEKRSDRIAEARQHTWEARMDTLLKTLEQERLVA